MFIFPESELLAGGIISGWDIPASPGGVVGDGSSPAQSHTLQEVLQREKHQFEEKLQQAARRKRWLAGEVAIWCEVESYHHNEFRSLSKRPSNL